ncbi:hypothetical protein [Flavobacterium sp. AG291]|uniref:hypothetical protein n=1 Tax=Flavobacterium sp. AG291 TaxID=2184000 RepID=UPI000E0C290E|nr:hypothetical protein [Flavobacterium sp. AG291]RDI05474.1 hypothetical protein DEU42_11737 [Flavobacterium sp. AG291]
MINSKSIIRTVFFAVSFFSFATYSQSNDFPDFREYQKVGLFISPVLYSKAKVTRDYGDYILNNKKTANINFGFDYLIRPEHKWAFKTGLHLDMVPMYNFSATIKEGDLWPEYNNFEIAAIDRYKFNFTIPLLVQIKKQMGYNLYFNLETGFNMMLMQKGGYSYSAAFSNEDMSETREVFAMYADTNGPLIVYPNLVVSPGFYFALSGVLLQTNVIYQKPLIGFFEGEYQFGNLLQSGNTRGDYKMSGEYIGLQFTVHLKKKHRRTTNDDE